MIAYSVTYETWGREAAETGDTDDRGLVSELEQDDFHSMVSILRGTEPSCYPLPVGDSDFYDFYPVWIWFSEESENYRTGERTITSYHPKTHRDARYMLKAWHCANKH